MNISDVPDVSSVPEEHRDYYRATLLAKDAAPALAKVITDIGGDKLKDAYSVGVTAGLYPSDQPVDFAIPRALEFGLRLTVQPFNDFTLHREHDQMPGAKFVYAVEIKLQEGNYKSDELRETRVRALSVAIMRSVYRSLLVS